MNYKRISFYGAVLCTVLLSCKDNAAPESGSVRSNITEVEAWLVKSDTLDNIVTGHGSVIPNESVELMAEMAGQVTAIYFEEGTPVKKGAVLLQMDDSELRPLLKKNLAQLKLAKTELERKESLMEIKGISKGELESAELQVATLESDIDLTKARIEKMRIVAPFDGVIGLRDVSVGAYLNAGQKVASLVQVQPAKIEFTISETYASSIREKMMLEFTVDGNGNTFEATVYAFEPSVDPASRSLKVRALATNGKGRLLPGTFVSLKLRLDKIENGLLVPSIAVTQDIKGQKIFVVKDGKSVLKSVETGIQSGDLVQITSGVSAGDTVITTGLLSMKEGMPVAVKKLDKEEKQ